MHSNQHVLLVSTCAMHTGHDVLGSRYARNQDVLGSRDQHVLESIVLTCARINMYSFECVLGSLCTRIKRSRCTRVTMYSDQDMLGIKTCSDQEINMYSNQLHRYVLVSMCARINMCSINMIVSMCARVDVCSDHQHALGSTCTRIKRSRCARIKTLEELAPESLDEGLGLGLPLPFSTFLFLPLTPPSSPNFAMDDPSGESWGDLDLFMSWNLGAGSWLDWEALWLSLGERTGSRCTRIKRSMCTQVNMLSCQVSRDQDVRGSRCARIKMHLDQDVLGSRCTQIERSRCTRIKTCSESRCVKRSTCARGSRCTRGSTCARIKTSICTWIKMYSDQEIKMYSTRIKTSICTWIKMCRIKRSRCVLLGSRHQYVLGSRCTQIKRSRCIRLVMCSDQDVLRSRDLPIKRSRCTRIKMCSGIKRSRCARGSRCTWIKS